MKNQECQSSKDLEKIEFIESKDPRLVRCKKHPRDLITIQRVIDDDGLTHYIVGCIQLECWVISNKLTDALNIWHQNNTCKSCQRK